MCIDDVLVGGAMGAKVTRWDISAKRKKNTTY
jgi:hypothetical protein